MENFKNKEMENQYHGDTHCCKNNVMPSKAYLCLAGAALVAGGTLKCIGHKHMGLFIGQLAAPILLCGIYHKLIIPNEHEKMKNMDESSQSTTTN